MSVRSDSFNSSSLLSSAMSIKTVRFDDNVQDDFSPEFPSVEAADLREARVCWTGNIWKSWKRRNHMRRELHLVKISIGEYVDGFIIEQKIYT